MDNEKHVDESWKDAVSQEKSVDDLSPSEPEGLMEINFLNYLTSLVLQSLVFLGELPNPTDNEKVEANLPQAKLLIDTLLLLRDKTKGNLSKEEEDFLNMALYELQMKFVERTNGNPPDASGTDNKPKIQI